MNAANRIISLLVSAFYVAILVFILLVITDIKDSDICTLAIVFNCIGFFCLIARSLAGGAIQKAIGAPMAIVVNVLTALYVFIIFVLSAATYSFISANVFLLVCLILTFLYFCAASAIALIGKQNKN